MSSTDLELQLDELTNKIIKALGVKQQEKAKKEIAKHLRANMRKRLTAQEDIEGKRFEPRQRKKFTYDHRVKTHTKAYKNKKMLIGFRDKAWLRVEFAKDRLTVGYKAGRTGKTAQVHNEGLSQYLKGRQNGFWANYPERRWIGLSAEDQAMIEDVLADFLTIE